MLKTFLPSPTRPLHPVCLVILLDPDGTTRLKLLSRDTFLFLRDPTAIAIPIQQRRELEHQDDGTLSSRLLAYSGLDPGQTRARLVLPEFGLTFSMFDAMDRYCQASHLRVTDVTLVRTREQETTLIDVASDRKEIQP